MQLDSFAAFCDINRRCIQASGGVYDDGAVLRIMWADSIMGVLNAIAIQPSHVNEKDLQSSFILVAEYLRNQNRKGYTWLFEESCEPEIWASMISVADTSGLRLSQSSVAMAVPKPSGTNPYIYPEPAVPHISFQLIRTKRDMERFADLAAEVFEAPTDVVRAGFVNDFLIHHSFSYLALLDGVPVSVGAVMEGAGWLYIANVATLENHRRKGYASALIQVAVREAVKETGIRRLMLMSSAAGQPVYEKLGFSRTGEVRAFGLKQ
jgi:GNAT superfamily N-acetyltransferase